MFFGNAKMEFRCNPKLEMDGEKVHQLLDLWYRDYADILVNSSVRHAESTYIYIDCRQGCRYRDYADILVNSSDRHAESIYI